MRWNPFSLKNEACLEAYDFFDKYVRKLPRKSDGNFDERDFGDNDVDAFRHAYVSGVFAQEYGNAIANVLGILNEIPTFAYNSPNTANSRNMDLWNNAVGRKYGGKTRKRHTLAEALIKAMNRGEMIMNLRDKRKYGDSISYKLTPTKPVIVLKKSNTGRNEVFFDLLTNETMSRAQFVAAIKKGSYPGYHIAIYNGIPTPVSNRDGLSSTNLG
jgi:hypothetical protein